MDLVLTAHPTQATNNKFFTLMTSLLCLNPNYPSNLLYMLSVTLKSKCLMNSFNHDNPRIYCLSQTHSNFFLRGRAQR